MTPEDLDAIRAIVREAVGEAAAPSPWLTRTQAAKRLQISIRTFDARVRGEVGSYPIGGGAHRFRVDELDQWLAEQRTGPAMAAGAAELPAYASPTRASAARSPRARAIAERLRRSKESR